MKATVKWYDVRKRYGYLTDDKGQDYFVHESGIVDGRIYKGLAEGDEVEFDLTEGKKGQMAANVKITNKATGKNTRKNNEGNERLTAPIQIPDINN